MLPWAKYWYNTNFQGSAKCTPFEIVYGRYPPALTRFILAQYLMTRDGAFRQLKYHFSSVQDHMIKFANRKQRPYLIKVDY